MTKFFYAHPFSEALVKEVAVFGAKDILINSKSTAVIQKLANFNSVRVVFDMFDASGLSPEEGANDVVVANGIGMQSLGYIPVCPSSPKYLPYLLNQAKKIASNSLISGVVLDGFSYPANHLNPEPELFDTCYCDRCIRQFKEFLGGESLPTEMASLSDAIDGQFYLEWLEFKCSNLTRIAKSVKEELGHKELGVFCSSWTDKEFGSAAVRVLGSNLSELYEVVDMLYPYFFIKQMARNEEQIKDSLEYMSYFFPKVTPVVLGHFDSSNITVSELESLLKLFEQKGIDRVLIYDAASALSSGVSSLLKQ